MDINTLASLLTLETLPSNYLPIYIRRTGTVMCGITKPSTDIFKYRIVNEETLFIKNDVNYLDLVSLSLYKNYSHTRTLYTLNSAILDPINTKNFSAFAVLNQSKLLTTLQQGILRTNKRVNYSLIPLSISYIFKSLAIVDDEQTSNSRTNATSYVLKLILDDIISDTTDILIKKGVVVEDILQQLYY